jgi:lipopolysaccharide/colanic/teichoic acid biosynthesis glycosyltransferase
MTAALSGRPKFLPHHRSASRDDAMHARAESTHGRFMINHDLEYIERASFWFDLKIMVRTPLVVMRGEGAL